MNFKFFVTFIFIALVAFVVNAFENGLMKTGKRINVLFNEKKIKTNAFFQIIIKL